MIDAGATADHIQTAGCGGGLNEFNWAVEYSQYKLAKYMVEKKAVNQSTSHLFYQRGRNKDIGSGTELVLSVKSVISLTVSVKFTVL